MIGVLVRVGPRLSTWAWALLHKGQMAQGQPAQLRSAAPPGEVIGRYRVAGVLGKGGMGIVYRAEDPCTGAEVAIKTVRSPHESDLSGLRRETSALWRLRHPGVVRIFEEGVCRGYPWFAMELLHGTSLRGLNAELWAAVAQSSLVDLTWNPDRAPDLPTWNHDRVPDVPTWNPDRVPDLPRWNSGGGAACVPTPSPWNSGGGAACVPARPGRDPTRTSPRARTWIDESTVSGAMLSSASPLPRPAVRTGRGRPPAAGGRLHEVLLLMRGLCAALAYLHDSGYVHRDLKPTNVFLRPDGTPVLMDFGLVCHFPGRRPRESLEPVGIRVGTVHYMAPEQVRAEAVDARADLYSLGCLLYEAVTGRRPFEAGNADLVAQQQLDAQPQPPRMLVSGLPPALDDLILRLLVKDPRERTMHADEVAEELARVCPGPARETDPVAPARRTPYFFRPTVAGRRSTVAEIERVLQAGAGARGRGAMIFLAGERGLGKTLMLGHTVRQAALRDYRVITGRCLPAARGQAGEAPRLLDPLRGVLRSVADRCRKGGPGAAARLLGPRAAVLAPFEPALCPAEPVLCPVDTGRDDDAAVVAAVVETMEALAREQGLLLALDDLQWADPLTLAVLQALRPERLGGVPLIVVGAYRPEETRPELQAVVEATGARQLVLGPLSGAAVTALAADLLSVRCPPAALVQLMERGSRGNPARMISSLRDAAAGGLLVRRNGRWVSTRGVEPLGARYATDLEPSQGSRPPTMELRRQRRLRSYATGNGDLVCAPGAGGEKVLRSFSSP
jgi:hypothetical protein